jgi:hypothetical protein
MLRMRVYRLSLPITVMGVEVWALAVIGGATLMSLNLYSGILPFFLTYPAAGATGFGILKIVTTIKRYFPGKAFFHLMAWLGSGDRYSLERETRCMPLIITGSSQIEQRRTTKAALQKPKVVMQQTLVQKE